MIPDSIEPVVGYRAWVIGVGNLLYPVAIPLQTYPYPLREPMKARCLMPSFRCGYVGDPKPNCECNCGIHATKDPGSLWQHSPVKYIRSDSLNHVIGSVYLWGRVIEHEHGYRAEYAYPKHLYAINSTTAERISELYNVPCDEVSSLSSLPMVMELWGATHDSN